jgi:alanine dehydrogenase
VLVIGAAEVARAAAGPDLLGALAGALVKLSAGQCVVPGRSQTAAGSAGYLLTMPGCIPGTGLAAKLVTVFPGNAGSPVPTHQGVVCLFDEHTGSVRAVIDGTELTRRRTAGLSALSVQHLAREDAAVLAVVGAGAQAEGHLEIVPQAHGFAEVRLTSRRWEAAREVARKFPGVRAVRSPEEAVRDADVVCLCTSSPQPVIQRNWLRDGTHLTSVGGQAPRGEVDQETITASRLFVETPDAFSPPPVGCAELAGHGAYPATTLGDVIAGQHPGREDGAELTLFKAMGNAAEDVAVASLVWDAVSAR